ncbi:hypothetical protein ACHQM5_030531 [Ranunculus cassubicifolius]
MILDFVEVTMVAIETSRCLLLLTACKVMPSTCTPCNSEKIMGIELQTTRRPTQLFDEGPWVDIRYSILSSTLLSTGSVLLLYVSYVLPQCVFYFLEV